MRVPLTLACAAYDRTAGLARGEIQPEGLDLTFLALPGGTRRRGSRRPRRRLAAALGVRQSGPGA